MNEKIYLLASFTDHTLMSKKIISQVSISD